MQSSLGSVGEEIKNRSESLVAQALMKAENFLKKIRTPLANTSQDSNIKSQGTAHNPLNLEAASLPAEFRFNHSGSLKSKGPYFVVNQLIRKVMNNEDIYINWAKFENLGFRNKMVVLVIADVNGLEIYDRIVDGRLSALKNLNNLDHSVVFDLFKQDDKAKFWSRIFDCPRVDKAAVLPPNSFKGNDYLLSAEDMRILFYPSDLDKQSVFYSQTDLWPPVEKNDYNKLLAIDCEMVITKAGREVARISIVNEAFQVIYDALVLPSEEVLDWATE